MTSPADQSNPFGLYDYLLVYHPEEHTATMELLDTVEKGRVDLVVHVFQMSVFVLTCRRRRILIVSLH